MTWNPQLGVTQYQVYQNLQNFLASGSFQRTMASLFLYFLFVTALICTVLGKVSKSPAEISPPIGAVLELLSRANLPCLVKLALRNTITV